MRRDPRFHQPDIRSTARSGRAFASGTRYPRRGLAPPSWQSCRKKPCRRWRAGWAGRLVMPGISAASTSPSPRGRYLACSVGGWGNGQHSRGCGCGGTGCQPVPEAPRGKKGGMLAREAGRGGRTQVCRVCGSFAALPGSRTCETGATLPGPTGALRLACGNLPPPDGSRFIRTGGGCVVVGRSRHRMGRFAREAVSSSRNEQLRLAEA